VYYRIPVSIAFAGRLAGVIRSKLLTRNGRNSLMGSLEGKGAGKLI
jgi:hypothetical protein